jgi:hypothetical protein
MTDAWANSPYRCEICGHGVDRDSPGVARRVTGWVKNGSTAIRQPGPVTAWAHWVCVEVGESRAEQQGLF